MDEKSEAPEMLRCDTCRWWLRGCREPSEQGEQWVFTWKVGDEQKFGECRIRSSGNGFPSRYDDDWCGEHEPKKDRDNG